MSQSDGDDGMDGGVGYISRLEVENFKSYAGHQIIGPFKRFTAVIGPNGSGKSNLMDAVAFVLGEKTKAMRGAQLRDLLHVPADASGAEADAAAGARKHCRVTLVFVGPGGEETHFTRALTAAGSSEYRIDGASVSYDTYDERLQGCGVLIKARNCLVYQGDIDAVATKSPKELTALLEAVSGSGALRGEYEAAEAAKSAAEASTAVAFAKRKGAAAQKKQKKEQKEEAERHTRLADELRDLKVRRYLFQLCHVEQEIKALEGEVSAGKATLAAFARRQLIAEKEVGEKKKDAARLGKDALLAEKKAAKAAAAAEEFAPAVDKAAEEAVRVGKRLKAAEKALASARAEARRSAAAITKMRADAADLDAAAADAQAAAAAEAAQGAFAALTPALEKEYAAVKAEAAMRTHAITAEIASEERAVAALRDVATASAQKLAEVDARLVALGAAAEEASERRGALRSSIDAAKAALAAAKAGAGAAADEARKARQRGEHLDAALREIDEKLTVERATRRDTERERRLADAVATLAVSYLGVQGRLVDLIDVPNRKHRLAITVALGRWADAVVTDNNATARECIKHLKEQRMERLVFIPLQEVRVAAVDERLRQLGGSAKLCVDCCVAKAPGLERAIAHALGDTLLCDTHEEAKRVAFGDAGTAAGGSRHKVVSLDGTLCARWGGITGGASGGGLAEGGTRFDRKAYDELKSRKAELAAERARLPSARDGAAKEAAAKAAEETAQRTLSALQGDAKATEERGAKAAAEAAALTAQRDKLAPEAAAADAALATRASLVAAQRARVAEITDSLPECVAFCAKIGAANIRQYEQAELAARKRAADAAARFAAQKAKLAQQLDYETARDLEAPVARLEKQVADCHAALGALGATADAAKAAAAAAGEKAETARAEAAAARAAAADADTAVAALAREIKHMTEEGTAAKRTLGGKEAALASAVEKRAAALRESAVEALRLPRLGGPSGSSAAASAMDVDGDGDDDGDGAGGSADDPAASAAPLDYSLLPRAFAAAAALAGAAGSRERDRLDAELRAEIEDKAALLEKLAPNLKAGNQYEAVKERERALADELEAAKAAAKEATAAFAAKRAERYAAFMAAFNHIAAAVDPIYKALTKAPEHPVGGSAYLSAENAEEPFLHGVKFHAMPPTKRFRDMEQLSGGEKTVAALALLFAVHSFRPSPFFVLDEVDAALDKVNVGRVARFVAAAAAGGAPGVRPFQSVVISLKDGFYDKADALVGVYRDAGSGCSRTLTLDLGAYA